MVHHYGWLRNLGIGTFGSTELVNIHTGSSVGKAASRRFAVMKTIDVGRLANTIREQLLQEVQAMACFTHPNLVSLKECFLDGGMLCLVSVYFGGGNVAGCIEKAWRADAPLVEPQIIQWFSQAALALDYLHGRSVLHRDLRARRLLLDASGHVIVSGIATSVLLRHALSPERPILEAMRYLSPELIVSTSAHSAASDMWALGVVFFELLTLRPPFEHE